jgi:hypothetical protein
MDPSVYLLFEKYSPELYSGSTVLNQTEPPSPPECRIMSTVLYFFLVILQRRDRFAAFTPVASLVNATLWPYGP